MRPGEPWSPHPRGRRRPRSGHTAPWLRGNTFPGRRVAMGEPCGRSGEPRSCGFPAGRSRESDPRRGIGDEAGPRGVQCGSRRAPPGVRAGDLLCHPRWRPRAKAVPESAVLARKWELKPVVGLQGAIDAASEVPPRPTAPIGEAVPAASGTASVIVPLPAAVRPRRSRRVRLTVPAASLARRRPSLLR